MLSRPLHPQLRLRNSQPYACQRALVIGAGNSGGQIKPNLAEAGVAVTLALRAVQILPRDLLGLPLLTWAVAQPWLPRRWRT